MSLLNLHACVYMFCTVFTLLPHFPTTYLLPLVPALPPERTCSALLLSDFAEEKKEEKHDIFVCLR
jgi:hypothetical protein